MNNRAIAHLWANEKKESANGSNFFFENEGDREDKSNRFMVTKVRFMYFLLMYIMLIFSSCGDDGNEDWENGDKNTSQTEFKLSPPDWLIGTWKNGDGLGMLTFQCTKDNIIYGLDGASMNFVKHAQESAAFYNQSNPPLGDVKLYEELRGNNNYKVVLSITQMGVENKIFVEISKISSTEIYINTEEYNSQTKFTKVR